MKNQNDLIVTIVALVVGLGVGLGFYFNKRTPIKPADPQPINVAPAKPKEGAVEFGTNLPGGSSGGGGAPGGPQNRKKGGAAGM